MKAYVAGFDKTGKQVTKIYEAAANMADDFHATVNQPLIDRLVVELETDLRHNPSMQVGDPRQALSSFLM